MIKNRSIIIVSDYAYYAGGAEKVAIDTARKLSERAGNNVYLFCGVGPICGELVASKVNVTVLNVEDYIKRSGLRIESALRGLYDLHVRNAFIDSFGALDPSNTVVHFHSWFHSLSASVISAAKNCGFSIIISLHEYSSVCGNAGLYNFAQNKICLKTPCSSSCIVCNCDKRSYAQKLYRIVRLDIYRRILGSKISRVLFVSETSKFILESTKAFRDLSLNAEMIYDPVTVKPVMDDYHHECSDYYLFVGRVSEEKGIALFCEAVIQLNVKGIVVGDGPLFESLQRRYPQIFFVGRKNPDEVLNYMKAARALVFPSVLYETLGLVVLEAMISCALPCIVSEDVAASEFVQDGINGLRFATGSKESLMKCLEKCESNSLIKKFSSSVEQEKLYEDFCLEGHVRRLTGLYDEIKEEDK